MATYGYTFQSGDGVTPTRLNDARTVSDIVNADIKSDAAIAGTKISPNFGAQNVVTTGAATVAGATAESAAPSFILKETDAAANNRNWDIIANGTSLFLRAVNDAYTAATNAIQVGRSGTTLTGINVNTNVSIAGSGSSLELYQGVPTIRFSSTPNRTNSYFVGANISDSFDGGFVIGTGADLATGTGRVFVNSSGNVGIGTSSPGDRLTLAVTSGSVFMAANNGTVNTIYGTSSGNVGSLGTTSNHAVSIIANNTEVVRVKNGGQVGINNNNPAYAMDVTGTVNATGVYRVNGTQVVEGRRTGWAAPTGTATRTTFATSTVTTAQLAERVKALIDDLTIHGLIGA